jgi:hypothetical protein
VVLFKALGEIDVLLQDDGDARKLCHLFEGVVQVIPACLLLSNWGNPRPYLLVWAMTTLWRRILLGGVVWVAHGL